MMTNLGSRSLRSRGTSPNEVTTILVDSLVCRLLSELSRTGTQSVTTHAHNARIGNSLATIRAFRPSGRWRGRLFAVLRALTAVASDEICQQTIRRSPLRQALKLPPNL